MEVIVYSTQACSWCTKLKEWLTEHNIGFKEIDVGLDVDAAKKMVEKSGQMGIPVIEIDGQIVVGFDINKLKELLKIEE